MAVYFTEICGVAASVVKALLVQLLVWPSSMWVWPEAVTVNLITVLGYGCEFTGAEQKLKGERP